ncbi:hypothetical protein [Actinomadura sp. 3N407]|uniref:hypothetical protein n=1 Tax=Actinomadura sp. 3N407 TaxID=3457423 RepID=UPI003FCD7525
MVGALSQEAKDAFAFDQIPWDRFPCGPQTRDDVARMRSDDPDVVRQAVRGVNGELANSSWSVAALAVPFLLRVAADPHGSCRAYALEVAADAARSTLGPGRRQMLRLPEDEQLFEPSGYPGHWGIAAARDAITADLDLVLSLLADPAPDVRPYAAYAAVAASGRLDDVRSAVQARLGVETDPIVRAGLVFAVAQLACRLPDPECLTWTQTLWADPATPPAVRISAALSWLCLTDSPPPEGLLFILDVCATDDTARLMAPLPWLRAISYDGVTALHRWVRGLLHPDTWHEIDDPWAPSPTQGELYLASWFNGLPPGRLPDPYEMLKNTKWARLGTPMGQAASLPAALARLLDPDPTVRADAARDVLTEVTHQNTVYEATVPVALYIAAILNLPSTTAGEPAGDLLPTRFTLLEWLGDTSDDADDESVAAGARIFGPDHPDADSTVRIYRELRPAVYRAVQELLDDPDSRVRDAALIAAIPLAEHPALAAQRDILADRACLLLAASSNRHHRNRALDALRTWGHDTSTLENTEDAAARQRYNLVRNPDPWAGAGSTDDPPF